MEEYLAGVASDYEKHFYVAHQKEFTIQDNLLYLQATLANSQDTVLVFVIPTADQQAAIDGCHHSAGYQGCDHTLSLMKEQFLVAGHVPSLAESHSQLWEMYSIRG